MRMKLYNCPDFTLPFFFNNDIICKEEEARLLRFENVSVIFIRFTASREEKRGIGLWELDEREREREVGSLAERS